MQIKDLANAGIHRINRLLMRLRLTAQYRFGLLNEYQPNPFAAGAASKSGRVCEDRFAAFSDHLPAGPLCFMDIGCNTGYFVFRLAERGGFGLGIDTGRNEIMVCRTLAELHEVRNVAFSRLPVTPENVGALPRVDLVVLMSVFHHFVRHYGEESAMDMLAGIARTAGRFMVFETGQPDETSSWAGELAFMGDDPAAWAVDTLRSLGFDRIHQLGRFATSVSDVKRHLLLAERFEAA